MRLPQSMTWPQVMSWTMLTVAVIASAALVFAVYPIYADYVRWTERAVAEIVAASVMLDKDTGMIRIKVRFVEPSALFPATIEAIEFNLYSDGEHCGFYRIAVPDDLGALPSGADNESWLPLSASVAPENSRQLIRSQSVILSGHLAVRISLPRRKHLVRYALEGDLGIVQGGSE